MEIELTTMCCVLNRENNSVLMIDRKKSWTGLAFPGGHLENGESIVDCAKRELYEETGLDLHRLQYKGISFFNNIVSNKKHIIFNFFCDEFDGRCKTTCNEGDLFWIPLNQLNMIKTAEGMHLRFPLFLEDGVFEFYVEWNELDGYTKTKKINIS